MNRNKVEDFELDHFGLPKLTSGGGGGVGLGGSIYVNFTIEELEVDGELTEIFVADKTKEEIFSAYNDNKAIIGVAYGMIFYPHDVEEEVISFYHFFPDSLISFYGPFELEGREAWLLMEDAVGSIQDYDYEFEGLVDGTTSFEFTSKNRCYKSVDLSSDSLLSFDIANNSDNHVRIHNIGSDTITLRIGEVTFDGATTERKIIPANITCIPGGYIVIHIVSDSHTTTFTVSDTLLSI